MLELTEIVDLKADSGDQNPIEDTQKQILDQKSYVLKKIITKKKKMLIANNMDEEVGKTEINIRRFKREREREREREKENRSRQGRVWEERTWNVVIGGRGRI